MATIKMAMKLKYTIVLIWIAAITAFSFLLMVELFNRLALDDLLFANLLKDKSIWNLIKEMYIGWSGRFMVFLFTGIQMKSYLLFNSMFPFSIVIYSVNIVLVSKALINFFKMPTLKSILFSIILFQLYVYTMFDISSYFWLCTKIYTLLMSLSLFVLSDLICSKKESVLNFVILFLSFALLGCSYEIYAPIIILLIGLVLLFKFYSVQFSIKMLVSKNRKLIFSFFVGTLFFVIMLIAPGNWVRLSLYSTDVNLNLGQFFSITIVNSIHIIKLLFFKLHYFLFTIVILLVLINQKSPKINTTATKKSVLKGILYYYFIAIGLCLLSIGLNTFAIGKHMEMRAFNHINLLLFLFIAFSLFEISRKYCFEKGISYLFPITLLIIIVLNTYNLFSNYSELDAYAKSEKERQEYLEKLNKGGNKAPIKLKELYEPIYHSIDDCWRILVPKFSKASLLKQNEVSGDTTNHFNIEYKKYYNLNFSVYTTLYYGMEI
jgi:hypothetical protein